MSRAQVAYGALLPVPQEWAFAFVSDPRQWPLFFPTMESGEPLDGWGSPGGRARMRVRFLGRLRTLELELLEWDAPRSFRYLASRPGWPPLDHARVFVPEDGGTRLRASTVLHPRPGVRGVLDRVQLRLARRLLDDAMARLPAAVCGPWRS